jgi:uncharacterized phage-associated protein
MPNVFDVAKYILDKIGPTSAMKLQKLVYYAQAWSLVWDDAPLFENKIEAWANGPVVRDLYIAHRGQFIVSSDDFARRSSGHQFSPEQCETLDEVISAYGNHSAQWLSDQTHSELPWQAARQGLKDSERGDREITLESMAEYYSSLQ